MSGQVFFRMGFSLFGVLILLTGCLNNSGKGSGNSAGGLDGVYQLNHSTENTNGCDTEGPSVLETTPESFMALYSSQVLGYPILASLNCVDTADCRQRVTDAREAGLFGLLFSIVLEGNATEGYHGEISSAWSVGADSCMGSLTEFTLDKTGDSTVQLEGRMTDSAPFPQDAEGFCDTEDIAAHIQGQPCVELMVKRGTFTASL